MLPANTSLQTSREVPDLCLLTNMRQILCAMGLSIMNCVCGREVYRLLLCIVASNTFYSIGPYVTLLFFLIPYVTESRNLSPN